jgi:FtsP/CotA-like multicopper oxidase with cupredoxin domain
VFDVASGSAVRLRVVNTSITRYWRLSVPGHVLYRVGGQGGLLDRVRVEGGTVEGRVTALADGSDLGSTDVSLGYDRGQIVLAPAQRADLVLTTEGDPGDVLELRWEDFARGRHTMWMDGDTMVMGDAEDDGTRPGEVVATFRLGAPGVAWAHGEGDPVLAAVGRSVGAVDPAGAVDWTGDQAMVLSESMDMFQDTGGLWQMTGELYIDGQNWRPTEMGPESPQAPSARHAALGQTLWWELRNESHMSHPVHLHGFSYQPRTFVHTDEEAGTATTWSVDWDEFEDTTLLPGETAAFVLMPLADPAGDGRAAGRWMRHCHIFQHAEQGMMSELIVDP